MARIKNKRPLRTSIIAAPGAPDRDSTASSDALTATIDQSYRDKFKNRSKYSLEKSYRVDTDAPASPGGVASNPEPPAESTNSLFQTFSDTLLATFTPGKGLKEEFKDV